MGVSNGNNAKRNGKSVQKRGRNLQNMPPRDSRPATSGRTNVGTRMNIKEQTPSQRRTVKENKRIDPNHPEVVRSAKRRQGYKIKKKKKKVSRAVIAYSFLFLVVFLAVCSVISLLFYVNLVKTDASEYSGIKLIIGLEHEREEADDISVNVDKYMREGVMYVNMTAIAEEFGFITTGDHKELRFITDMAAEENVIFCLNSPFAKINGTMVRLDHSSVMDNGSLFVPADFFKEYVNGIEIGFDEEEAVITVLRTTERNDAGRYQENDVTFKLKTVTQCVSLPEVELSAEIQAKCYFLDMSANVPVISGGDN